MNNGFYTALGTPLTEDGRVVEESLVKHIEQQIEAGAAGLLLMGSMGIEAQIMNSEYGKIVDIAERTVAGRLPLFVGAMDNSIARVMEKIDMIGEGKRIDGIVLTVPFYYAATAPDAVNWFISIADKSPYPIYLYDLAVVTKYKITIDVIDKIIDHPNIKGIKTADWEMIKMIERKHPNADFDCLYSGLDAFDYAWQLGIRKNLDGMFCCTPKNGRAMYDCLEAGDLAGARRHLDNILLLRNTMIANGLMRCFTECMSLLGYEGNFHQDYIAPIDTERARKLMCDIMTSIGEL